MGDGFTYQSTAPDGGGVGNRESGDKRTRKIGELGRNSEKGRETQPLL